MGKHKLFYAYVDGACSGNGGPKAVATAAALLLAVDEAGTVIKLREFAWRVEGEQTAHRAELTALVKAIEHLKFRCQITIFTDSAYLMKWKRPSHRMHNHYRNQNLDLWEQYDQLAAKHNLRLVWCKGHADNYYHNRVDKLARTMARGIFEQNEIPDL